MGCGKQGELMRPDTASSRSRLKFRWDIHYSQAGEEITSKVELGIYFYPKGQEPSSARACRSAGGARHHDIRPNTMSIARIHDASSGRASRASSRTCTCAASNDGRSALPSGQKQVISLVSDFNFNRMTTYGTPTMRLPAEGHDSRPPAWHDNTVAKKATRIQTSGLAGRSHRDEAAHARINIVYMSDADYDANGRAKRATAQQYLGSVRLAGVSAKAEAGLSARIRGRRNHPAPFLVTSDAPERPMTLSEKAEIPG
jgi:hypothetical protein